MQLTAGQIADSSSLKVQAGGVTTPPGEQPSCAVSILEVFLFFYRLVSSNFLNYQPHNSLFLFPTSLKKNWPNFSKDGWMAEVIVHR